MTWAVIGGVVVVVGTLIIMILGIHGVLCLIEDFANQRQAKKEQMDRIEAKLGELKDKL